MDIKIFNDNSNIALIDIEEALQSVFDRKKKDIKIYSTLIKLTST